MRKGNGGAAVFFGFLPEYGIADVARGLFKARTAAYRRNVDFSCEKRNLPLGTEIPAERLVRVGFGAAEHMIDVHGDKPVGAEQGMERMNKTDGIRAAGKADERSFSVRIKIMRLAEVSDFTGQRGFTVLHAQNPA